MPVTLGRVISAFTAVIACTLIAAPLAAAERGWWAETGAIEPSSAGTGSLRARLAELIDPDRVTTVLIDIQAARAALQLSIPIDGVPTTLVLTPHAIRTENFRLIEHRDGGLLDVAPPAPATYRSVSALPTGTGGEEARAVTAAVSFVDAPSARGVRAMILVDGGSAWYVQPAREIDPAADEHSHIVYPVDAVRPIDARCGGALVSPVLADRVARSSSRDDRGPQCLRRCQIAVDSDFEYFTLNGSSSSAVVSDVESLMNAVSLIYERDIRTTIVVPTQIVRATNVVYTNAPTIGDRLDALGNEWRTTQAGVVRDLAHLMSGVSEPSSVIGLAFLDVICDFNAGYGVSIARFTSNFAARVGLVAHEVGHNFSAPHCDGEFDCSIMCSGLGGCANNLTRFSSGNIPGMIAAASAAPCLETVGGAATPAAPGPVADRAFTLQNVSVDIDVLANDFDPNCEALTIAAFDPVTLNSGTVSRVVGAGPGGRDLLRFAARANFSGIDSFSYTAQDPTGRAASATVRPEVLVQLLPSNPGNTAPGLNLDVYRLGSATYGLLPDFGPLAPYASAQVDQINYPAASTNVVGSGRDTAVAARFTATLSIPIGGTWTFFTESDDGSALFINSTRVVFNDFSQGMTERSGTISLVPGNYAFRVEYANGGGPGGMIVRYQGPAGSGIGTQVIPASALANLLAEYFVPPATPQLVPVFAPLTPFFSAAITALDFPAPDGLSTLSTRGLDIGASFTGWFISPAVGVYTFSTESDDGSLLYINNRLIVNNDGPHGMIERNGAVGLRAGVYPIRIDYYQGGGGAGVIARVDGPPGTGLSRRVLDGSLVARSPRCAGDFNFDSTATVQDIFDFVSAYFAGNLQADSTRNGVVSVEDIFTFLAAWFTGC